MPSALDLTPGSSLSISISDRQGNRARPVEEVLVFQHDPFEDLGVFAEVLEKQRTTYRVIRLFHGETPADDRERMKALIVLGGRMNSQDEESYPFLRWEKRIIRAAIDEAVPVLGICLGAQLIAATLGSAIYQGRVKEIGWSSISMTPHGQVDSLLGYLPENATVFQWHGDGFDLPSGAIRLASSSNYENQAFRLGKTIYGLQFHLEVTPRMIERWMDERSRDLAEAPYVIPDKIRADTQSYAPTLKYYGERFIAEFLRRAIRVKGQRGEGSHGTP